MLLHSNQSYLRVTINLVVNGILRCGRKRLLPVCVVSWLLWLAMGPAAPKAAALSMESFALDSIAAWGKFPRFCVGVYQWGDKFFNSYDSTYVQGSGKRWNVKMKLDSWFDQYDFRLIDGTAWRWHRALQQPSDSILLIWLCR